MSLTKVGERVEFSSEVIKQRGFIRARYANWDEPRNGLIVYASKTFLKVLFLTGVNIAASYFSIKISEVEAGLWEIIYSPNFETFYKIKMGESEDENIDLLTAVRNLFEGEKQNGSDESGIDTDAGGL